MSYFEQIQRVEMLLNQDRPQDAEKVLDALHHENPDSGYVKYLYSRCKADQADLRAAMHFIKDAIGLEADNARFFCQKAIIHQKLGNTREAYEDISRAISLDPNEAAFWGLRASLLYNDRQFRDALAEANQGLLVDPEDSLCLNIRSLSQSKLNMPGQAAETIRDALETDPNNSLSHATHGFLALQKGNARQALDHFREALRIDPTNEYAKSGLVEALKSKFFVYRWFYLFFEWMSRQSGKLQWGVIISIFIVQRIIVAATKSFPNAEIYLLPILYLLCAFVLLTWIIVPLSNLLLRLNPYGRYALTRDEIQNSTWTGILLATVIGLLTTLWITHDINFLLPAMICLMCIIPVTCIYRFKGEPIANKVRTLSLILIASMSLSLLLVLAGKTGAPMALTILAFIGYQFYINHLSIRNRIV